MKNLAVLFVIKLVVTSACPTGVILRDSHGVAQVRFVTGNKILRILKAKGLAAEIPEDLYHLIKKAVAIRKHLERNRKVGARTVSLLWENGGLGGEEPGVVDLKLKEISWEENFLPDNWHW